MSGRDGKLIKLMSSNITACRWSFSFGHFCCCFWVSFMGHTFSNICWYAPVKGTLFPFVSLRFCLASALGALSSYFLGIIYSLCVGLVTWGRDWRLLSRFYLPANFGDSFFHFYSTHKLFFTLLLLHILMQNVTCSTTRKYFLLRSI